MFALATAIKVFPVAVFPYLVWRRQWAAAASMLVFVVVFLLVLPAPFRGFQHNVGELKTWYQGMVGSSSEKGFGQREEQNWSWVNQSIIAMTHRLTRPIDYVQDEPGKSRPARYMNVANLDFAEQIVRDDGKVMLKLQGDERSLPVARTSVPRLLERLGIAETAADR